MVRNAGIAIVVSIMSMTVAGQAARPQDVELQKAIRTETVEGNEVEAIRQYGELAAKYAATDRSITAQALLRQARLYQKHGDARATSVLERIVNQFGDQRQAAAQAQQALGGNRRVTQERVAIVTDDKAANAVSPDGRWIVFASSSGFVIRRNGSTRDHVSVPQGDTPVFSADSKRVAYNHWGKREFHVASLDGAWNPRVVKPTPQGVRYYDPGAWSADGQSVLVEIVHEDWSKESAWLTLATGESGRNFRPVWSPDGRSIAYLRQRTGRPPDRPSNELVVHSMPDHSEQVFNSNDLAMQTPEWLADGTRVLVTEAVAPVRGAGALPPRYLVANTATGTIAPATDAERPRPTVRITLPAGTAEEQRATALSPDGTRSAFVIAKRGTNTGSLWIAAADGQGGRQLAAPANTRMLVWAADSRAVYFLEPRGDDARLMRVAVDGGAPLYTGVTLPLDRQRGATLAGSQLVVSQESAMSELWVVRNFAGK